MKKLICLCLLLLASTSYSAATNNVSPLKRIMFDDLKVWLSGGQNFINWGGYINKENLVSTDFSAPYLIFNNFEANAYAAENRYNKVPQKLIGTVYSVSKGINGKPKVLFPVGSGEKFEASGFEEDDVLNLKRGDQFEFVCLGFTYSNYNFYSHHCTTVQKFSSLMAVNLFNDIDDRVLDKITMNLSPNLSNLYIDFSSDIDKKTYDKECLNKDIGDVYCQNISENIINKAGNKLSSRIKLAFECYKKDKSCSDAAFIAKRYNIDFDQLLEKENSDKEIKKKTEREKILKSLKSFIGQ